MRSWVINFVGGPGAGKSSSALELASRMKWEGMLAEYVPEVAKKYAIESHLGEYSPLKDQIFIFGKQHNLQYKLVGQVEFIVVDSPLFLATLYNVNHPHMNEAILESFNKFNNINFLVRRLKPYSPFGRYQDEASAIELDNRAEAYMVSNGIPFHRIPGAMHNSIQALEIIKSEIADCGGLP